MALTNPDDLAGFIGRTTPRDTATAAVDGKPLELQTRDELMAHVRTLEAENDRLSFEANAGRQAEVEADAEAKGLDVALDDAVDSLKYVQDAHPETTGRGVRAERILKAEAILAKAVQAKAGCDGEVMQRL